MGRIFDALQPFLDQEGIRYELLDGTTVLRFGFKTETHAWVCVAEVREKHDLLLFASLLPEPATEARRAATAELLGRINSHLAVGNFEMDYDNGDLRYRTSLDLEGAEAAAALMRQLLRANLSTVARFLPVIDKVLHGESSPVEALAAKP